LRIEIGATILYNQLAMSVKFKRCLSFISAIPLLEIYSVNGCTRVKVQKYSSADSNSKTTITKLKVTYNVVCETCVRDESTSFCTDLEYTQLPVN
jgi:hypothetical protein